MKRMYNNPQTQVAAQFEPTQPVMQLIQGTGDAPQPKPVFKPKA